MAGDHGSQVSGVMERIDYKNQVPSLARFRRQGIPLLIWIALKCHGLCVLLTVSCISQSRSLEVHDQGPSMCGKTGFQSGRLPS